MTTELDYKGDIMPDMTPDIFPGKKVPRYNSFTDPNRITALAALQQTRGIQPEDFHQYIKLSNLGTPLPSFADDKQIWLHPKDIPDEIYDSIPKELMGKIVIGGMSIPLAELDDRKSNWLGSRVKAKRDAEIARGRQRFIEKEGEEKAAALEAKGPVTSP